MRYRRWHTHNGVMSAPGDPYGGTIDFGRFLFARGVLETDGGPDDHLVTTGVKRRRAWGYQDDALPTDESSTAWNSGETKE